MTSVRLIHGIHEKEGQSNMGMFAGHVAKAMPSADVKLWQYGFLGFWQARFRNRRIAKRLAADSAADEVWITHSNGAAVAYLAVRDHGARPRMIININPALDRWRTAPVPRVETIHSDNDRWVHLSQWLPFHVWGDQGKVGYRGDEDNTINHNATQFSGPMAYKGHCGMFDPKRIRMWATYIAMRIEGVTGGAS